MSKVFQFTEDQIWSYMHCPVFYYLVEQKIVPAKTITAKRLVEQIARMFFAELMNGRVLSANLLKKEWDKLCRKHKDMMTSNKVVYGYACLMELYKWAEQNKVRVLDITRPYNLMFHSKNNDLVEIKGDIPLITVNLRNTPEIMIVDYNEKHTNQERIDLSLKLTLYCLAYKTIAGRDIGIHVINLKYGTDTFSYRNIADYKRLEKTITNVAFAIENQLFYPREGLGCLTCDIAGACRTWH